MAVGGSDGLFSFMQRNHINTGKGTENNTMKYSGEELETMYKNRFMLTELQSRVINKDLVSFERKNNTLFHLQICS